VHVVVCRNETNLPARSSGPDVCQAQYPQRFARRQVDRDPKPANDYGLAKGGNVYP
jgi:hypothetical protein